MKKLIKATGFDYNEKNYHIVVANYNDKLTPIGLLHGGSDFNDTRFYGLTSDELYYIFISKSEQAESFLSVLLTAKSSPFEQNLLDFLSLFFPIPDIPGALATGDVWIDIRKFDIPKKFQKFCDMSVIVKKDLAAENYLATAVFDNSAKERWSFGLATAITSINDVNLVDRGGIIVVEPKPYLDLAEFGVINYHFRPVDTKQRTVGSSWHLLGGLRLADHIEPLLGVGFGFPTGFPFEIHLFGGFSVEFANELKSGFSINQQIEDEVNPFKTKIRFLPRYGIELKFP